MGTMGRTMLSSAATVFVDVAASQIVGLTMAPFDGGVAAADAAAFDSFVDGAMGRNGSDVALSFDGEAYFRSWSSVAWRRLQTLQLRLALLVQLFA